MICKLFLIGATASAQTSGERKMTMKKIFCNIAFCLGALLFLSFTANSAYADTIFLIGPNSEKLTPPLSVLNLQHRGNSRTESGSVSFNGRGDVATGNLSAGPHNGTVAFSQMGAANAGGLRILLNINEPNGGGKSTITINSLVLTGYNQSGQVAFSASLANVPITLDQFKHAQGSAADYAFGLDQNAINSLQAALAAHGDLRLGLAATITNAQGGPERFGFSFAGSSAPVPEPTTMLLLGTGLVGVAARVRKRRKNKPE